MGTVGTSPLMAEEMGRRGDQASAACGQARGRVSREGFSRGTFADLSLLRMFVRNQALS